MVDGRCRHNFLQTSFLFIPGVMIPIPQYPLYSASLAEYGLSQCGYYLDEERNWGLDVAELERSLAEASKTAAVRALVVINPGNPTGQVRREHLNPFNLH